MPRKLSRFEVLDVLRQAVLKAGSLRAWAKQHDCAPAYVSDVLSGRRNPGPKILGPLGYIEIRQESQHYEKVSA